MRNPFQTEPLPPESEADAGALFSELSTEELSPSASASIRGSLLAALSATTDAVGHSRFAFAAPAVLAPLVAIGAVSAATGESPLQAPVSAFTSVATSLGVVSAEEPVPNESFVLAQEGEPEENNTGDETPLDSPEETPDTNEESDLDDEPAAPDDGTDGAGDDQQGDEGPAPAAVAAHTDGNGCDDVLFANGAPPFATPGGPVGCEVGNSGDHRQNGANHQDDEEETPDEGDTGEETPDDGDTEPDEEEANGPGGTSRGLGRGHDEDRPGNGNGYGHDKHGHDPNPDGHGPGGPNADDGETGEEPATTNGAPSGPGNSGNAPGKANNPGNSGNAPGKNKNN